MVDVAAGPFVRFENTALIVLKGVTDVNRGTDRAVLEYGLFDGPDGRESGCVYIGP